MFKTAKFNNVSIVHQIQIHIHGVPVAIADCKESEYLAMACY
jgi:hypothetical protein